MIVIATLVTQQGQSQILIPEQCQPTKCLEQANISPTPGQYQSTQSAWPVITPTEILACDNYHARG